VLPCLREELGVAIAVAPLQVLLARSQALAGAADVVSQHREALVVKIRNERLPTRLLGREHVDQNRARCLLLFRFRRIEASDNLHAVAGCEGYALRLDGRFICPCNASNHQTKTRTQNERVSLHAQLPLPPAVAPSHSSWTRPAGLYKSPVSTDHFSIDFDTA